MKMYVYRGLEPNFGDELNRWLLPKIFPNFFDDDPENLFLGIGSIMYDRHPSNARKIVFGSGYGGYTLPPKIDETWNVYCVRGPRTAAICGLSSDKVAADSAILINRYQQRQPDPPRRISFIPHFESSARGKWQRACKLAGLNYIDPRSKVEDVIAAITSSSCIIAEAMHGAIVADALRVPWIAALPMHRSHRYKWFDWAEALDIRLVPRRIWPSSAQEVFMSIKQRNSYKLEYPTGAIAMAARAADTAFVTMAAARLSLLAAKEPMLSTDTALNRALDQLETHAAKIQRDF